MVDPLLQSNSTDAESSTGTAGRHDLAGKSNEHKSRVGLTAKFMLLVNSLLFVMGTILAIILLIGTYRSAENQLQKRGLAIAHNLAATSLMAITKGDFSSLESTVKSIVQQPAITYAILVNQEGRVLAHSNKNLVGTILNDPLTTQALKANQAGVFGYRLDSHPFYDVAVPLTADNADGPRIAPDNVPHAQAVGVVRVGISREDLHVEFKTYILLAASVLVGLLGVGAVVSLFFVRLIIAPLKQMTDAAVRIAGGNFSQQITVQTHDEVGILAQAFNHMSMTLKDAIKTIQTSAEQMITVADRLRTATQRVAEGAVRQARTAGETSGSIEHMSSAVRRITANIVDVSASSEAASSALTEVSVAVNQVAASTTTLSSSVDDTASSLTHMSSAIQLVARNVATLSSGINATIDSVTKMDTSIKEVGRHAKESAQLSEQVSQDANELGTAAIEKTIESMTKIKRTVDQSSQVINKLNERTGHIGKILTVIDEVTKQTDLLALNAAILAAQAGNEGKGFAVVADEIKSLADRTEASTREIAQLIQDVQREAHGAVASIREGTKSVDEGVTLSHNARNSLNLILQSSQRSSVMSRHIELATLEQVKATSQVTGLMQDIGIMVQEINTAIRELENGTRRMTDSSERMREMTLQVKTSTKEQAEGSRHVSGAVQHVASRIHEIAQAMNEQKQGNERILQSMLEIDQIASGNRQMLDELNGAMEALVRQADSLQKGVIRFKV